MTWGESDPYTREIKINKNLKEEHMLDTFFHEITHQVLQISGLYQLMEDNMEEAICDAIGAGIGSVFTIES